MRGSLLSSYSSISILLLPGFLTDTRTIPSPENGTSHPVTMEKARDPQPVKTRFRLNKRFQPAVITALADIDCEPIVFFVSVTAYQVCESPYKTARF